MYHKELVRRIDRLEDRISALEDGITRPVTARKLYEEEIREIILIYIPTLPPSESIYPSDIAYTFTALVDEGFHR